MKDNPFICFECGNKKTHTIETPKLWFKVWDDLKNKRKISEFCKSNKVDRAIFYQLFEYPFNKKYANQSFRKQSTLITEKTYIKYNNMFENYYKEITV